MREGSENPVLTAEDVLCSTCSHVYVPGKVEKAVFTTVEALWSSYNPVYVGERHDKALLTAALVL